MINKRLNPVVDKLDAIDAYLAQQILDNLKKDDEE